MSTFNINNKKVIRSYNGKNGCMCGCKGTYSVPSDIEDNNGDRVSDRSVSIATKKVNDTIEKYKDKMVDNQYRDNTVFVGFTDQYAWVKSGDRNTVIYY